MTLYTYARTITDNPDAAREIVLDALASAKKIKPAGLVMFLLVTVRNKCYDYLRLSGSG